MTISLKQFIVILSSIFILGTLIGISEHAYADKGRGHYEYKKDHNRKAHRGPRYDRKRHSGASVIKHGPGASVIRHGRGASVIRHGPGASVIRHGPGASVIHRGRGHSAPAKRWYRYRNINVVRHHGPMYRGYGHYFHDNDAYPWLAFTAITLKVLDNVNEEQQRAHESAQVKAAVAPIGERITWNEGRAAGSVTPIRDGISTSGRYCREFQHEVTVAGKRDQAYGTACRQPDGSWQVISTENP